MCLIRRHPFESGNRRTAFVAASVFLRLNGEQPHSRVTKREDFDLDRKEFINSPKPRLLRWIKNLVQGIIVPKDEF